MVITGKVVSSSATGSVVGISASLNTICSVVTAPVVSGSANDTMDEIPVSIDVICAILAAVVVFLCTVKTLVATLGWSVAVCPVVTVVLVFKVFMDTVEMTCAASTVVRTTVADVVVFVLVSVGIGVASSWITAIVAGAPTSVFAVKRFVTASTWVVVVCLVDVCVAIPEGKGWYYDRLMISRMK